MTIAELEEAFLKAQTAFNADKKNKKLRNKWKSTKKALNKARKKAAAEAKEKAAKEKAAAEAKEKAAKEKAAAEEKSKKKAAEEVMVKLEKKKAKNGYSEKEREKEKQRREKRKREKEEQRIEKAKRKEKEKEKGAKTLFLTNLPQSMKDDDIRDFFKGYGKLDIELRKNQYTDRFTGRASVGFASAKLATKAMAEKESTDFMGCSIKIRHWNWGCENGHLLSRPLSKKNKKNCNTVFIGTVPKDVDREKISEFFGPECVISEIRYLTTKKDSVKIKYAAYVEFENPDVAVDVAVGKNGQKFEGITVRVDYAKSPKKRKKSQKKSPKKRKKST